MGCDNYIEAFSGSDLSICLNLAEGDFSLVLSVEADLKKTTAVGVKPNEAEPIATQFSVLPDAENARWILSISGDETKDMVGVYCYDARIEFVGGAIEYTGEVYVEFEGVVTKR